MSHPKRASEVTHHGSHRSLLTPTGPETGRDVDAIVVPAARPAENLLPAMVLAAELGAAFVALTSCATRPAAVVASAAEVPGLQYVVVPVAADYEHWLVDFTTSAPRFRAAQVGRLGDLSLKRNLGVLLGRLAGWRSVLFLDDDIGRLRPERVRRAASALAAGGAVGMPATRFPDNSVVCHANRLVGNPQGVFVSGSALLVDEHLRAFFPRVYNEDWLFLAEALARGAVSAAGDARQLAYDPFLDPARAEAEEFGDILAEGLVGLLHAGRPLRQATANYWDEFLTARRRLIQEITTNLPASGLSRAAVTAVRRSLDAAERRRASVRSVELESYVAAWQADLVSWRRRLDRLPSPGCLHAGLRLLGLAAVAGSELPDPMATALH